MARKDLSLLPWILVSLRLYLKLPKGYDSHIFPVFPIDDRWNQDRTSTKHARPHAKPPCTCFSNSNFILFMIGLDQSPLLHPPVMGALSHLRAATSPESVDFNGKVRFRATLDFWNYTNLSVVPYTFCKNRRSNCIIAGSGIREASVRAS